MEKIKRILPLISYIVARSVPGNVIGCDNKLPWRLSSDLKRFRTLTEGHVVIMGRKTLESIGRPLPRRINIVITRDQGCDKIEGVVYAHSINDALFLADHFSVLLGVSELFVIGGAEIYRIFQNMFNKIYLTEVECNVDCGDAHFDYKFNKRIWKVNQEVFVEQSDKDEFDYRFIEMERKIAYVRQIDSRTFIKNHDEFLINLDVGELGNRKSFAPDIQLPLLN